MKIGRIIARTLTLCAITQAVFGLYLLGAAALNVKEARRVMSESE